MVLWRIVMNDRRLVVTVVVTRLDVVWLTEVVSCRLMVSS